MKKLAVAGLLVFSTLIQSQGQTTISAPITIPLEIVTMTNSTGQPYYKYGIWVGLGGSDTPQLFEFDTGGEGFYAAYGATNAPWWGTNSTTTSTPFYQSYGSGNTYTGYEANTTVSLYGSGTAGSTALITSGSVSVGQATQIGNGSDIYWDSSSPSNVAPVQGYFYGDFGLSLKASENSISNIFTQLNYDTNSIVAGFIVKAAPFGTTNGASVQVGILPSQTNNFAIKLNMQGGTNIGGTYQVYSAELINVGLALTGTNGTYSTNSIAINLDTGNPTPGFHSDDIPAELMTDGAIDPGVLLQLLLGNTSFFDLTAGDYYGSNFIYVESKNTNPYLNVGAQFFQQYEVMFDFQNGVIGLNPLAVPEASQAALMGTALVGLIVFAFVRQARRRSRFRARRSA